MGRCFVRCVVLAAVASQHDTDEARKNCIGPTVKVFVMTGHVQHASDATPNECHQVSRVR